jgi:ATP-binding cassette subfamily B multidrug efflux pump
LTETKKNKKFDPGLIRRILAYTRPYKKLFYSAVCITLFVSCISIVRPKLVSYALNDFVNGTGNVSHLNQFCLYILGVLFLEAILQVINMRITNLLGQNIVYDLRQQVYKHVISLKNTYFDTSPVGMLVTRTVSDIESLSEMFSEGFIVIIGDIVMILVFVAAMLYTNWLLALLSLSTLPLLLLATMYFKNGVKKTFNMVRTAVSELNTFTQEHITGMKIVQLFNKEQKEFEKFSKINDTHRKANIKSIFYYSVFFPVVDILSSVSISLVIWFAGVKSNTLNIGLGDITFFIMMVNMFFRPIRFLADRLNSLQMGIVSAERVFKVLDTDEKIDDSGKLKFEKVKESIEFRDVSFAYLKDHKVLKNVSFKINSGETIALVGSTGSGKTTIINLLSRFYEDHSGEILIDGKRIEDYELSTLRLNTGVVLQDVHLFNDTVFNNITLKNERFSKKEVEEATRQTGLYEFVMQLPGGFDYVVTERGQSLSAGQKQLIAFIRAYLYKPALFILDEATATIDSATEQLIQRACDKISQGRTSIIIAHRLSTIKNVKKIYLFESGTIAEQGSMDELIALNGKFKNLYDHQFTMENIL